MREHVTERLRSEFQYQPKSASEHRTEGEEPVIQMDPFIVSGKKDHHGPVSRIFMAQRQLELEQRPSLEGGASIERNILGRPATIGPAPTATCSRRTPGSKPRKPSPPAGTSSISSYRSIAETPTIHSSAVM
jgi:hypothetical protein